MLFHELCFGKQLVARLVQWNNERMERRYDLILKWLILNKQLIWFYESDV